MAQRDQVESTQSHQTSDMALSVLKWGIGIIFVIAPFYAPLTIFLASHLQHLDFWKIWKELLLTVLGVTTLWFAFTHKNLVQTVLKSKLFIVVLAYALLLVLTAVFDRLSGRVAKDAVIYGLIVDLRLVGFFAVTFLAFQVRKLRQEFPWAKVVLVPAAIVITFGLLQFFVLPKDFLRHIGYSKTTTPAYETVDNRPDFVRLQSTLRGPNPLGAYLLVIIAICFALILYSRDSKYRILLAAACGVSLIVLYGTYSRSAWLGLFLALAILALRYKAELLGRYKLPVILVAAVLALVGITGLFILRGNYTFQNVIFHSSSKSTSAVSSNAQRASALQNGVSDVLHHPLGGGVGSAGPASLRNTKGPGKIAENYFIQIGQEVGVFGMLLFIVINVLLLSYLFKKRSDPLAQALFASLVGIIFINLLSHAWTDDTLAYTWWGLAGIVLAPDILNKKRKHNEADTKKATS